MFVTDITIPNEITVDTTSKYSLIGATYNNAFCGLMSIPDIGQDGEETGPGVIYAAPYTQAQDRPHYNPAKLDGFTEFQ